MDSGRAAAQVDPRPRSRCSVLGAFLQCAGAVLVGIGLKLGLVARCGGDIPYFDQWAAEGASILRPWLLGQFSWRAIFWPHGEHHPAVARASSLLCFVLNGQWDDRVQRVANVALFAVFLAALVFWVTRLFADWRRPVALALVALLLGAPGIHENYLWGFQVAFLGALIFGMLHLAGMVEGRGWRGWALGALAGVIALFSIAAGAASAAVLAGVAVFDLWRGRGRIRAGATLLFNLTLLGWAWWLMADALPASGAVAHTVVEFWERAKVLLAWPLDRPVAALLHLPLAVVLVLAVRGRGEDRPKLLVAVLGLWCWALIGCLAVGRGNGFNAVAVRYWDVLATGMVANALALLVLWPAGRGLRLAWLAVALVWATCVGAAYWRFTGPEALDGLVRHYRALDLEQRTMVTSYLQTGRFGGRGNGDTHPNLPHPVFTRPLLDDPAFRRVLPPSVVPACTVEIDETRSRGFARTTDADGRGMLATVGPANGERVLVSREIVACGRPYLRLAVRGVVAPGVAELFAEDEAGRRHDLLNARVASPGRFKTEHLDGGAERFRIVARVKPGHELAFTEPIELGRLSYLALKFLRQWPWVLGCGVACFLVGVAVGWRRRAD